MIRRLAAVAAVCVGLAWVAAPAAVAARIAPAGLGSNCAVDCVVSNAYGNIKWDSTNHNFEDSATQDTRFNVGQFSGGGSVIYIELFDYDNTNDCLSWTGPGAGDTGLAACGSAATKWKVYKICPDGTGVENEQALADGDNPTLTGTAGEDLYMNAAGQCGPYTGWDS
jgi:hypothetical protein